LQSKSAFDPVRVAKQIDSGSRLLSQKEVQMEMDARPRKGSAEAVGFEYV